MNTYDVSIQVCIQTILPSIVNDDQKLLLNSHFKSNSNKWSVEYNIFQLCLFTRLQDRLLVS